MSTWEDARKRAGELTAAGDVVALDVGDNYALTVPSDTSSEAVFRYLTGIAQWEAMGKDKPLIVELDDEQKRLPSFVYPIEAACVETGGVFIVEDDTKRSTDMDYRLHIERARLHGLFRVASVKEKREAAWFGPGSVVVVHSRKQIRAGENAIGQIFSSVVVVVSSVTDSGFTGLAYPVMYTLEEDMAAYRELLARSPESASSFVDIVSAPVEGSEKTFDFRDTAINFLGYQEPFLVTPLDETVSVEMIVTSGGEPVSRTFTEPDGMYWILKQRGIPFDDERFKREYNLASPSWETCGESIDETQRRALVLEGTRFNA